MFRLITLVSAFIIGGVIAMAQPNIGSITIPSQTRVLDYIQLNPEGVDPGPGGVGATWDFSAAQILPVGAQIRYVMRANFTTELAEKYPNASFAVVDDTTTKVYLRTAETVQWLGTETPNSSAVVASSDPYDTRPSEIVFSEPFEDNYSGTFTANGVPVAFARTGQLSLIYDGFGTVTLPGGKVVSNVSRTLVNESSVDVSTGQDEVSIRRNTNRAVYYEQGEDTPLLIIERVTIIRLISDVPDGEPIVMSRVLLDSEISTSVAEQHPTILSASFPNPASGGTVTINNVTHEPASIVAVDVLGRAYTLTSSAHFTGNSVVLDINSLPAASYRVRIQTRCHGADCNNVESSVIVVR